MSDPFEELLFPPPDKSEAAKNFIKLKSAGMLSGKDDQLMAECIRKSASLLKESDENDSEVAGPSMSPPSPPIAPNIQEYLATEQGSRSATEQSAANFYAQKLRAAAEEMGLLKEELAELQEENAAAQEQLSSVEQTIQTTQQEGQLAQQAALQNAQQANAAAQQAMAQTQQAVADATQAKLNLQEIRSQLLQIAGQDPGIATMGAPGAVPGVGQPMLGPGGPSPMDPPQQASADPNAEAAPQDPSQAPTQEQGANSEASGGSEPSSGSSGPPGQGNGSKVQVKVGGAHPALAKLALNPAIVGGLLGAAGGAGLAGLEASGYGPSLDRQREKVDALEQGSHAPGLGGFAKSIELAKQRAILTLGEATQEHPVMSTIAGGLAGAGLGATAGPQIAKGLTEAASYYKNRGRAL